MEIRELKKEEYALALKLSLDVFSQFEAPDYSQEGANEFKAALSDTEFVKTLRIYGAFDGGALVGTLATRKGGEHISLFFVDGAYHRRGIGRALFTLAAADNASGKLTVHSSPYAVEVYHRLGFRDTAPERTENGIRYTPMECMVRNPDCTCKKAGCVRHGDCVPCREHHKGARHSEYCERKRK